MSDTDIGNCGISTSFAFAIKRYEVEKLVDGGLDLE
jgi:ArsR family metal-binding transcriptional regulator